MSDYLPTIGLEIHAELLTMTKMFCSSKNNTSETKPNVNICPVCMGHPGTLPTINKEAIRHVLRMGTAVGGELADYTEFDRKNYFYPDIPKGYQISQYKHPLIKGGVLDGIKLTRVHLEEDTARSTHDKGEESLVDFNRAGVPLMELVTEPVIHDAATAAEFAKELQLLLWYLKASAANMEKGEMRVEANVSVSKNKNVGTKVEVKNLNSFKAVEKAIRYEVMRQTELLERGEVVLQETRGWDEHKEETFSQRSKEESHDYRYFPDPDLPKLFISEIPEFQSSELKKALPELPWDRRKRFIKQYGVKEESAEIFVRNLVIGRYFEDVVNELTGKESYRLAESYVTSDLISFLKDNNARSPEELISAHNMANVVKMLDESKISSRGAKEILKILVMDKDLDAFQIAESNGLLQTSSEADLLIIVDKIIRANEKAIEEYKSGKLSSLQFLIGQAMKESKGSANPQVLKKLFEKQLS